MDLEVDRVALRLSGLSEVDGRRLVQLVAEALASEPSPAAWGQIDALHVTLTAQPAERPESMAHRIVTEMLRVLVRAL